MFFFWHPWCSQPCCRSVCWSYGWPVKTVHRYVDDVISRIGRMFPDMSIELFRPNGTSAVLLVGGAFPSRPGEGACLTCLPLRWLWGKCWRPLSSCARSSLTEPSSEDTTRMFTMKMERWEAGSPVWLHDSLSASEINCLSPTAGHLDQVSVPGVSEGKTSLPLFQMSSWSKSEGLIFLSSGNGPRHHCPAALPAAPDAWCGGPVLYGETFNIFSRNTSKTRSCCLFLRLVIGCL